MPASYKIHQHDQNMLYYWALHSGRGDAMLFGRNGYRSRASCKLAIGKVRGPRGYAAQGDYKKQSGGWPHKFEIVTRDSAVVGQSKSYPNPVSLNRALGWVRTYGPGAYLPA